MTLAACSWRSGLDVRLRKVGQDVIITRTLGPATSKVVTCRAFVRTSMPQEDPRGLNPHNISSPLSQPDMKVTISGTELDINGWPLTDGLPLPVRSDILSVAGKDRAIQVVTPVFVDGALARIDMTVRG